MNHDKPHTFPSGKIYWKKSREKINTDTINWEKLFDRSEKKLLPIAAMLLHATIFLLKAHLCLRQFSATESS